MPLVPKNNVGLKSRPPGSWPNPLPAAAGPHPPYAESPTSAAQPRPLVRGLPPKPRGSGKGSGATGGSGRRVRGGSAGAVRGEPPGTLSVRVGHVVVHNVRLDQLTAVRDALLPSPMNAYAAQAAEVLNVTSLVQGEHVPDLRSVSRILRKEGTDAARTLARAVDSLNMVFKSSRHTTCMRFNTLADSLEKHFCGVHSGSRAGAVAPPPEPERDAVTDQTVLDEAAECTFELTSSSSDSLGVSRPRRNRMGQRQRRKQREQREQIEKPNAEVTCLQGASAPAHCGTAAAPATLLSASQADGIVHIARTTNSQHVQTDLSGPCGSMAKFEAMIHDLKDRMTQHMNVQVDRVLDLYEQSRVQCAQLEAELEKLRSQ